MERPLYLREDLWKFLLSKLAEHSNDQLAIALDEEGYRFPKGTKREEMMKGVAEKPGAFLLRAGVLNVPELLRDVVIPIQIESDVWVKYVLNHQTIEVLKRGDAVVTVFRLTDNQELIVSREKLAESLFKDRTLDVIREKE